MPSNRTQKQIVLALVAGVLLGCVLGCIVIGTMIAHPLIVAALPKTATATSTATRPATITLAPTRTVTPTSTPFPPTATPSVGPPPITLIPGTTAPTAARPVKSAVPTRTPRPIVQHFMVDRPVAPSATNAPETSYLYGTTQRGEYDVHHGEEFENPSGTPLVAVANGFVVTAGNDLQKGCGDDGSAMCGPYIDPGKGYYGNIVVIQLADTYQNQRVFAVYGHMSKILVNKGDPVRTGDPVGEVGMSGIAIGPHLHFEIRLGVNDFAHTRNPILWMPPLSGRGAIVGRYTDSKGDPIRGAIVNINRSDGTFYRATETYSRDRYAPVNSDDEIGETFALAEVPVGDYVVRINGQQFAQKVTVQEGKLSYVELGGP